MAPAVSLATCSTISTTPERWRSGTRRACPRAQQALLDRIDATMRRMEPADFECYNNEVLRRPIWQELRELAAQALRAFGWEAEAVQPFVEVQPGFWQRPAPEAEREKARDWKVKG
jgi:hypothetical protein